MNHHTTDAPRPANEWSHHPVAGISPQYVIVDELADTTTSDKGMEYGFDRGYWAAMVDIMRHIVSWEAAGLKIPVGDDDGRYDRFNSCDEMIRHQLLIFFDEATAGWGEEFPTFEEWSA